MALLGLLSGKMIADGATETSASLDLSVSLCNNRSLCFLKLGRMLPAMKDVEKALEMLGGHSKNLAAWSKAMHRLASACTRAGLFKEASARLDTIEKATRSRAATAELRQLLRSLRENCSVACSGHKNLLDHLKERRAGLSEALDASDVEEAWFVIREHFTSFPGYAGAAPAMLQASRKDAEPDGNDPAQPRPSESIYRREDDRVQRGEAPLYDRRCLPPN